MTKMNWPFLFFFFLEFYYIAALKLNGELERRPSKFIAGNGQSLMLQKGRYALSVVEGIRAAEKNTSLQLNFEQEPEKGVFCYFFTRSPAESTAELLLDQLSKGCDGYAAFSNSNQVLGVHTIMKTFTKSQLDEGLENQMHFMTKNSWQKMAELHILGNYRWYVKFDADSFVQSSAVRTTFARYSLLDSTILSTHGLSTTSIDGFFVALPNSLVKKWYKFSQSGDERFCDEFLTGHNEKLLPKGYTPPRQSYGIMPPTDYKKCVEHMGDFDIQYPRDEHGNILLVNQDEGWVCEPVQHKILHHFRETSEPLCNCRSSNTPENKCYPRDFLTLHPVKNADLYGQLMLRFP